MSTLRRCCRYSAKMRVHFWCLLAFLIFLLISQTPIHGKVSRRRKPREFLFYRTNSITQRPCRCPTMFSCSCCETVTLLYSKRHGKLCSNFMYQRNGLNVDISLNSDTIKTATVSVYRPFKTCSLIPGSFFSSICVNVVELNEFPRSLTVCVRHEITSKVQEWQIDYTCVSISTELPVATSVATTTGTMTTASPKPMMMTTAPAMTTMVPAMATMASAMTTMASAMTTMAPATTKMAPAMTSMASMSTGNAQPAMAARMSVAAVVPKPEVQTGIIGGRGKRGNAEKRNKLHRASNIVNGANDDRPHILTDRIKKMNEHPSNRTRDIVKLKTTNGITNLTQNPTTSSPSKVKPISALGESANDTWSNGAQYFPSRIPPFIAKKLLETSFSNSDKENRKASDPKYSSIGDKDAVIFPE